MKYAILTFKMSHGDNTNKAKPDGGYIVGHRFLEKFWYESWLGKIKEALKDTEKKDYQKPIITNFIKL